MNDATSDMVRKKLRDIKFRSIFWILGIILFTFTYVTNSNYFPESVPYWGFAAWSILGITILTAFFLIGIKDYYEGKQILRNLGYK